MPRIFMFDAYGTLLDVHSAVQQAGGPLGPQAAAFSAMWRAKQLEYTWTYSAMGLAVDSTHDFERLTARALDFTFAAFGIEPSGMRDGLLAAYRTLSAFADVGASLSDLRAGGHVTAVFTNGNRALIDAGLMSAGISSLIDHVVTVEPTGLYKPAISVYHHAQTQVGASQPSDVVFVSSNRWDIAGAARHGFTPVWVNRTGQPAEYAGLDPVVMVADLSGLGGV
jgi:2-haloacid dehalogenase